MEDQSPDDSSLRPAGGACGGAGVDCTQVGLFIVPETETSG